MYFSRARLRPEAARQHKFQTLAQGGYAAHQLVWSLFTDHDERERDFLYRWEDGQQLPVLYTISEREPVDTNGFFVLDQAKVYEPKLSEGQRLVFSVRVNPIVSTRDENDRQQRHDVVMRKKKLLEAEGKWPDPNLSQQDLVYQEGLEWLKTRAEPNGFSFDKETLRIDGYRKHTFRKAKGGRPVTFVTMDFIGTLTVTDPTAFAQVLRDGLGPAKGYGCGMMMIRPA